MKKTQHDLPRRDFLKHTGLMTAGAMLLPRLSRAIGGSSVKDVGIQLYTVRKEMSEDAAGTLKKLAKIGFKELESARSDKETIMVSRQRK